MQSGFIFNPQEGVEGKDIKAWTEATLAFWACNFIFPSFPSFPNQLLQLSRCLPSGQYAGKLASKAVINLSPLSSQHRQDFCLDGRRVSFVPSETPVAAPAATHARHLLPTQDTAWCHLRCCSRRATTQWTKRVKIKRRY